MKTKKVVVGTMAAAMLSLTLSALPVTFAADETVQISVGSDEVKAGEEFTVDVTLSDIPSAGIQSCDFAVQYDSSLISVTSVSAGALTETGAEDADSSASSVPCFESYILNDTGYVNLIWSTMLDDSSYWLQGSGVFCTITGTVSEDADPGTEVALKLVAIDHSSAQYASTSLNVGYTNGSDVVKYSVSTTDGAVKVASETTTESTTEPTTESTTETEGLLGDANLDGEVNISDAVLIMSYSGNASNYPLSDEALNLADVYARNDGVNNMDALAVQKLISGALDELPESYA